MGDKKSVQKINLAVDLRYVIVALLVVLLACIYLWKPWQASTTERSIEAKGSATIKAEPDEYQFSPSYQEKGTDRAAIQKSLTDKMNNIVEELKKLGVAENKIVLASTTYDNYWNDGTNEITSNSITITVSNKDLAQKVQDYLATTAPQGQITPFPTFSDTKRKELESEARDKAVADAKTNAEKMATQLDVDLGKVLSITDDDQGGLWPMMMKGGSALDVSATSEGSAGAVRSSLPITPGEQEITYVVKAKFGIR